MPPKHPRPSEQDDASPAKRQRLSRPVSRCATQSASACVGIVPQLGVDLLSPLSDELLIRILSYLSLPQLLCLAPVSRRFHRLAEDSQLWKALYYARFVLPRAMRIPGFREGKLDAARLREHKLHYKGRRTLWADGRQGGLVRNADDYGLGGARIRTDYPEDRKHDRVNWKRQYKIRHNWARGKCAVEELRLGPGARDEVAIGADLDQDDEFERSKMLVKVVEGLAITADRSCGLRAWDLKTREVVAQTDLQGLSPHDDEPLPSCLAIDDNDLERGNLGISIGFSDGSFAVWTFKVLGKTFAERYRHAKSSNGELMGLSYSHPYLLTATQAVLISLYTFNVPEEPGDGSETDDSTELLPRSATSSVSNHKNSTKAPDGILLPPPYLITSLRSQTSNPPLALSIRRMANTTVASIAYTFFTHQGWSIGIQDLQIHPNMNSKYAPTVTTRLAYTTPFHTGSAPQPTDIQPTPDQTQSTTPSQTGSFSSQIPSPTISLRMPISNQSGPTTLCYTHPYLLATLPDNTLILHLCTSNASKLVISPGIRLWGHTSGISDAEITARGKAVSVSSRGEEMRVWELEGRPSGVRSRSVEIRPGSSALIPAAASVTKDTPSAQDGEDTVNDWEERRNWVGFDDEMVIVLKEARGGRESLLVYDFT